MRRQTIASKGRKDHESYFRWLASLHVSPLCMRFMNDLCQLHLQCNFLFIFQQSNCHWQRERKAQQRSMWLVRNLSQIQSGILHQTRLSNSQQICYLRLLSCVSLSLHVCALQLFSFTHWPSILHWPAHLALFDICFTLLPSNSATAHLQSYLSSFHKRRCHLFFTFLPVSRETFQLYPFQVNRVTFLFSSLSLSLSISASLARCPSLANHEQMLPERAVRYFLL